MLTVFGQDNMITPPKAKQIPKELTIHNHTRIDNYYWLNERENPEVINYLEEENNYTKEMLKHTEEFQQKLFDEIIGRIKQDDASVPYFLNGYWYYTRYEDGKEYPIYCRKNESLDAEEEIILNVNVLAEPYDYYQVVGMNVSPDNKILAFGVDTLSRRIYSIHFKNLETGEIYNNKIPNTTGGSVWANDNKTLFYTVRDAALRPHKILKHKFGNDYKNDKEVYVENDEKFSAYVYKEKSRQYIVFGSRSTLSSEISLLDANNPDNNLTVFHPRENDLLYSVYNINNKFYILSNWDAQNFRLMETEVSATSKENWKEVIPHRSDVLLEDITLFTNHIVLEERSKGLIQLRIINLNSWSDHYIDFGEEAYLAFTSTNPEFNTKTLRFGYTSLTTPFSTYDYNMETREKVLMKEETVLGDFDKNNYETKRYYAKVRDGELVPVSLVYRKDKLLKEGNPLLLYGYGSYGVSTDASFNIARLSLLDRGFVYAIAHIRGGQEMGRQWYEDGKFFNKINTFSDFIDCAEFLIEKGYTTNDKLFARGGSAGGLLMGAVINMRPDLFKGVLAAVPFVDVVTTMLDESIPLTVGEFDEWGNPKVKEYYDYMLSYSPYDNVETKNYPAMLVTTGLHDSQVQYWEPAKWVAKLRELKTDNNLLLLYTDMSTGHSGASGRFKRFKDTAMEFAFILDLAGIKE